VVHTSPIAVMDGECTLCSFGARMVHRLDHTGEIRICQIQTELGQQLMAENGLDPIDPESWLFIEDGKALRDFDALIRVGERSGGIGRLLSVLRVIPKGLRDRLYLWIARNRYRFLGRSKMCEIPDPALQRRMIG